MNESRILIIPYKTVQDNLHTVSLMQCEYTDAHETFTCVGFVPEDIDLDMYAMAVDKLASLGYKVDDHERWSYMGAKTYGEDMAYAYAVDITAVDITDEETEETEAEKPEFRLTDVSISDALNNGDGYACATLVQLFKYVFNVKDYDKLQPKRKESDGKSYGSSQEGIRQNVDPAIAQVEGSGETDSRAESR
jgi:hypothetical protein